MQQPPPLPAINPYAAPVARVEDVHEEQLVLADRGVRLAAKIIDGVIFGLVAAVFGIIGALVLPSAKGNRVVVDLFFVLACVAVIAFIAVNMVLLHRHGQTIAKRLFGIRIVRQDGGRCALSRIIFARWLPVTLLGAIPLIGWVVSLTDALMIFGDSQRCLHDQFADTIVVKV